MNSENNGQKQDFLSLPEVQVFLGIKSRKTILKYIKTGKLRAYKIGGTRWRFAYSDVHAFLKNQFIEIAQDEKLPVDVSPDTQTSKLSR